MAMLSSEKYLNLRAELGKYAELKALVGGTTAIQGMGEHPAYSAVEYLVRNVEYTEVEAQRVKKRLDLPKTEAEWLGAITEATEAGAWLLHLAEGRSNLAQGEFGLLRAHNLLLPQLVGIHSLGLHPEDFQALARVGGKMVWSPLSNLLLYGVTADVRAAKAAGVLISLAPDWSPSGSKSVLGELKVADLYNTTTLGGLFTDPELVEMVTRNPATALGWGASAGQLAPGMLGDVLVVDRIHADPYRNLILATETNVQLVVIRGDPLYGDVPVLRRLKTYREIRKGQATRVRRYERLAAPRPKAVDFQQPGIAKGDLSAAATMRILSQALRFDREALFRQLPADQVAKDLTSPDCNRPPEATPPSRADFTRFRICKFPGGLPPLRLDPLFTATDREFFRRLDANGNLPPAMKRLRDYYRQN
jgi:hypothetical protein